MLQRGKRMKRSLATGMPRGAARPLLVLLLLALAAGIAAVRGLLEPSSLLITVGGSFAVTWITFPSQRLASAWRHVAALLHEQPGAEELETEATIATLQRLARIYRVHGGPRLRP